MHTNPAYDCSIPTQACHSHSSTPRGHATTTAEWEKCKKKTQNSCKQHLADDVDCSSSDSDSASAGPNTKHDDSFSRNAVRLRVVAGTTVNIGGMTTPSIVGASYCCCSSSAAAVRMNSGPAPRAKCGGVPSGAGGDADSGSESTSVSMASSPPRKAGNTDVRSNCIPGRDTHTRHEMHKPAQSHSCRGVHCETLSWHPSKKTTRQRLIGSSVSFVRLGVYLEHQHRLIVRLWRVHDGGFLQSQLLSKGGRRPRRRCRSGNSTGCRSRRTDREHSTCNRVSTTDH